MRFDLTIAGNQQASRRLSRMGQRARRSRPILSDLADDLIEAEKRTFRSARWKPLADTTLARKRRQGLQRKVLRARRPSVLEQALTTRGAPGQKLVFSKNEVRFGLKGGRAVAFYGRFHQKGQGVPKRVVVPAPTARTRKQMQATVRRHLTS